MSLIEPPPPAAAQAAFLSGLPSFLTGAAGLVTPTFSGKSPAIPTAGDVGPGFQNPLEVFVLKLSDAASNASGAIAAQSRGWQFYAGTTMPLPSAVLGLVVQRPSTGAWKLISLAYGPSVMDQWVKQSTLVTMPEVRVPAYETRALNIPGVNVKAYWLVAQAAGGTDFVAPVSPTGFNIPGLAGTGPFQMPAFLSIIAPVAARNLKMSARAGA